MTGDDNDHFDTCSGTGAPAPTAQAFPVWKTIKLGTCKNPDEYRKALNEKAGYRIGDGANGMLNKIVVSSEEKEVDLVNISVAELGFNNDGAQYKHICARALEFGLRRCPSEVGAALRLAYRDQPIGRWLLTAMEAIADSDGNYKIFMLTHMNGLLLNGRDSRGGHPRDLWPDGNRFVFVRPRR